jgi:outer membrane protein TolC
MKAPQQSVYPCNNNQNNKLLSFMKKNLIIYFPLMLLLSLATNAQNGPVKRDTAKRVNSDTASLIEQKLVELAMNSPSVKAALHQDKIYEYQLKTQKNDWVNLLTFSYSYNDLTYKGGSGVNVYPKYFIGITVPLGTFLSRADVKAAKEAVEISKLNHEQLERTIKAEVIGKYRQYKSYGEQIGLQSELLNNVQAALLQAEDKFRKAKITIEEYNLAQRIKNEEATKLINLQLQQDLVKLDIESMIGTNLESVIR